MAFGWGYVSEFCISLFLKEQQEKISRIYLFEGLKVLTENTARFNGGKVLNRWSFDDEEKAEDNRSGEEIAEDVIKKCGLKLVDERGEEIDGIRVI